MIFQLCDAVAEIMEVPVVNRKLVYIDYVNFSDP